MRPEELESPTDRVSDGGTWIAAASGSGKADMTVEGLGLQIPRPVRRRRMGPHLLPRTHVRDCSPDGQDREGLADHHNRTTSEGSSVSRIADSPDVGCQASTRGIRVRPARRGQAGAY